MSESGEESPDWLRSYQAPSHSVVSVSSDSNLSPGKSPIKDDDFDTEMVSAHKNSDDFDGDKEDDQEQPPKKRAGRSSTKAPSKKTTKKRPPKVGNSTPSKRTKTGDGKRRGTRSDKRVKEESSDVQGETDVLKHSVLTLSSDSDEKNDAALIGSRIKSPSRRSVRGKSTELKLNKADHQPANEDKLDDAEVPEEDDELSSHESSEFEESDDEAYEALSGSRRKPASKSKTPRKKPEKSDNTTPGKKKKNYVKVPEEDELSPHESSDFQEGEERDDTAPIGSKRQSTPRVAQKGKPLKKTPEVMAKPSVHEASNCEVKEEKDAAALIDSTEHTASRVGESEKLQKKIKTESDDVAVDKKKKLNNSVKNEGISDADVAVQETSEKQLEPHVTSKLPLMLPEKVQRTKSSFQALVECEADSIDVSGDMGAVGRVVISDNPSKDEEMLLDLKGTIYKTSIVPCRTFCVVTVGQSEAKIDAIMDDFIQLKPQSNVYAAETMVEGTLDGFSFDSEDEADKPKAAAGQKNDEGEEGTDEQQEGKKTKGKPGKKQGVAPKKGKAAAGKHPRKRTTKKVKGKK